MATYNDVINAGYQLSNEEMEMCANKTISDINAEAVKLNKLETRVRQMLRDFFSRLLTDHDEDNPMEVDITIEPKEAFGLSSLELPHLSEVWMNPTEGWITFYIDDVETDFDYLPTDELLLIANEI
jgi:hypothetical protein